MVKHFVAVVMDIENEMEYLVKFLKKSEVGNFFVYPNIDDLSLVNSTDIVEILDHPTVNKRDQYTFHLPEYENIC